MESAVSSVRKCVVATTVAAMCATIAGCTSADSDKPVASSSPSLSSSASASPEPVTLRLAVYGNEASVASYDDLALAFQNNNPNVTVEIEHAPDAEAAFSELLVEYEARDTPDVFLLDHRNLPALVEDQRVLPVDALLEERQVDFGDDFQRDALEAFSESSALQCMPHDVSPLVVYYNEELLSLLSLVAIDEDPPNAVDGWSWEQFSAAARQMSRGRIHGVYIEPNLETLSPFIASAGGEIVDDPQSPTTLLMSDEDTRAALEQVLTLVRDPEVTPSRGELERQGAVTRFKKGKLGMILGTRALTPELRAKESLNFEVMPLPSLGRYHTIASMNGYCISSQSDNVAVAADFLAFATGRVGATITSLDGYVVPSNVEVALSPAFTQPSQQPRNSSVFNEGVRRSDPTPFIKEWPAVLRATQPLLERLFYSPVIDLDTQLEQIDLISQPILSPEEPKTVVE